MWNSCNLQYFLKFYYNLSVFYYGNANLVTAIETKLPEAWRIQNLTSAGPRLGGRGRL